MKNLYEGGPWFLAFAEDTDCCERFGTVSKRSLDCCVFHKIASGSVEEETGALAVPHRATVFKTRAFCGW